MALLLLAAQLGGVLHQFDLASHDAAHACETCLGHAGSSAAAVDSGAGEPGVAADGLSISAPGGAGTGPAATTPGVRAPPSRTFS